MKKTYRLYLNEEQFETLQHMFDYEFEQELNYQTNGDQDTELLEKYLRLYIAILKAEYGTKDFLSLYIVKELIESKKKLIQELKGEQQ